jgi:hypothetical protein
MPFIHYTVLSNGHRNDKKNNIKVAPRYFIVFNRDIDYTERKKHLAHELSASVTENKYHNMDYIKCQISAIIPNE